MTVKWPAEAIWEAVSPLLPGFSVEILAQIDSTNSELMRRARAGRVEPVLLVAERQSAGRGRLGRIWQSEANGSGDPAVLASLTFSLGLPLSPQDWSGLSLAIGLSVVESLHPCLQLKWPNDIWLHQRKLAGILIETASTGASRYAVIGVGINIAPRDAQGLSTPPAALREVLPDVDAPATLARVFAPLVQTIYKFESLGFAPFRQAFHGRDGLVGREVQCSDGTTGVALGVDANGALLMQTDSGVKRIHSAEVSVRPVSGSAPI